jgi:hypothetical protein
MSFDVTFQNFVLDLQNVECGKILTRLPSSSQENQDSSTFGAPTSLWKSRTDDPRLLVVERPLTIEGILKALHQQKKSLETFELHSLFLGFFLCE